jgi:hypothetical protein
MRARVLWLCVLACLAAVPALAQKRPQAARPAAAEAATPRPADLSVAGKWTYRSYINSPVLVGDNADQAFKLIFGEGVFTFELPTPTTLKGTFDMGGGFVLDLDGRVRPDAPGAPLTVEIVGTGRANTPTAGWEYDYHASLAHRWPNGVDQVPALVGTVIRAKPHDDSPAGFVASFVAVKQP